ncbi:unnamed protein product [Durusdinium trenchii]|uniref:Potassium channel domain-containing protein n=1 Tax=Durusdinium trenchii TaxID=1381693 RepID=A0ABP0J7U2_9DINO
MSEDAPPAPSRSPASVGATAVTSQANLRAFLEKLARRRKRISCSAKCRQTIEDTLRKLGGKQLADTGRIGLHDLKEILREPPKAVPAQTLREFVDVSTAYDVGDGTVDLQELMSFAFQTEPGMLERMGWFLPLSLLLVWMLLGPAIFCPVEQWSYLDGLYLSVLSLSTVGTGTNSGLSAQVYPTSQGAQIFLLVFVLVGTVLTIWFLLALSQTLLWSHELKLLAFINPRDTPDLLAQDGHGATKGGLPLENLVGDHPAVLPKQQASGRDHVDVEGGPLKEEAEKPKSILQIHKESLRQWAKPRAKMLEAGCFWSSIIFESIFTLAAGVVIALVTSTSASFLDACSWAVLTSLTVGYMQSPLGDKVNQNVARGLEVAYVLCSVFCILHIMFRIGRRNLGKQRADFELRMKERILPADLLVDLDKNGLGVNRLEFLCAALMTSDRVSGHDLSLALEMFQKLDPNGTGVLGHPQLEAFQRVKAPLSLSELLDSPQLHSQLQTMQFPARKSILDERTSAVLQEVYQDYDAVRRSLDAKDEELLEALREHSASEQARAQAVAQRESLRKEVMLLSQMKTDLAQRLDKEGRQSKAAQTTLDDMKSRNRLLEQKLRDLQLQHEEVNKRLTSTTRQLKDVQELSHEYQRRIQEIEHDIHDFPRRLQEQADRLQHEADTRVHQVRLEAAEQNLERQGEMQSAQLELKALSSSMEAMRGQLKQSPSPTYALETAARPLKTGLQPWEVWGPPAMRTSDNSLLSNGKVKEQLEFLDAQVRKQVEHLSSQVQRHADSITAEAQS